MTSLTKDGVTYYFEYDDEGHRVKKTKGSEVTCYYYSGDRLIAEICNEEYLIVYLYDENGSPIGFQYHEPNLEGEWVTLWYEKNLQGDVVALYTDAGVKLATYTYDAYGNCSASYIETDDWLIDTLATQNPIRYRGYYYDFELEFYCLGTRYYDSATGRFLSPDSVDYLGANGDLNSYNLYAYCSNNPIMYVDPTGHMPKWAKWVVGGLAIAGLAVATVLTCGVAGTGAAAMGVAMLSGGLVSAGVNAADQLHDGEDFDWTELAISTLSGTSYGLLIASTGGTGAWAAGGKFAVAGGTSLLDSWNQNASSGETLISLGTSLLVSGGTQGLGYVGGKVGAHMSSKATPKKLNYLSRIGNILSDSWKKPQIKTGCHRFIGGVIDSIFNDF